MTDRIMSGWTIFTQSWGVLKKDKELLVFPALSGLACLLIVASFVVPFLAVPEWGQQVVRMFDDGQQAGGRGGVPLGTKILYYSLVFLFYLVNYFIIAFFNTALVSCAIIRFSGGDPTVGDGLRAAASRLPQILGWAVFSATIGMLLKMIEERAGIVGRIVISIIGVLWAVASYMVVPILAVEGLGPVAAVKRSVSLLKKCWGEGLVGNFSMGLANFLLILPGLLVIVGGIGLSIAMDSFWPAIICTGLGVLYLLAAGIVMSTLRQIFLAGLYVYAAQDRTPDGFDHDLMEHAFRKKKRT